MRRDLAIDPATLVGAPLQYPHNDAIFASVVDATQHFANPLGKYYMYYGPHDGPGGIFTAYSDSLDGPWTQYDANPATPKLDPVIANQWVGAYNVSHVASPDAEWIPEENRMFLWFHGENSQTRYASTTDGLHFTYEGVAVDTSYFNAVSETSYARISRVDVPERNAKYVMTLMGNSGGTRNAYLAWSPDGRTWTSQRDPFITPHLPASSNPQVASPELLEWNGRKYVAYHQDLLVGGDPKAEIWATPVTNNFEVVGAPQLLFESLAEEDLDRVASPFFYRHEDQLHMFYDSGSRLHNKIRHATAPLPQVESQLLSLPDMPAVASTTNAGTTVAGAIDGNPASRWSAAAANNQWLYIDLGEERILNTLKVDWASDNARDYGIYTSTAGVPPDPATALSQWDMIAKISGRSAMPDGGDADGLNGAGGGMADDQFNFVQGSFTDLAGAGVGSSLVVGNASGIAARYLMIYADTRNTSAGPSIWELELTHLVPAAPQPGVWLQVDRATGQVAITNTADAAANIIGYSILSPAGSLDATKWISLQDQSHDDWSEANPTPQALNELKPTPATTLDPSTSLFLGRPFAPAMPAFGTPIAEDLAFEYVTADGQRRQGFIEYVGDKPANNLVLSVDPASGAAQLENNSPYHISLIGYDLASSSASLDPAEWNSLDEQNVADWTEANPDSRRLAELKPLGSTALASGDRFDLGQPYRAETGVRDLVFTFLLDGESTPRQGIVRYGALRDLTDLALAGDFNRDGAVDAADFTVWRDSLGEIGFGLLADADGSGTVDAADYAIWRAEFGNSWSTITPAIPALTIPEPSALILTWWLGIGTLLQRTTDIL